MDNIMQHVQKFLALPVFKVQYMLYSNFFIITFAIMSGGDIFILKPMTFYNVIFMGFLLWILEAKDKQRIILHAQVINGVILLADIYCLVKQPIDNRYHRHFDRTVNIIITVLQLLSHPLYALILYLEDAALKKARAEAGAIVGDQKGGEWIVVEDQKNPKQSSSGDVIGVHQKSIQ